jgi:hypothetical protein
MVIFIVICLSMAVLSAIFWVIEIKPFVDRVKSLETTSFGQKFTFFFRFIACLPTALPFLCDIGATIGICMLFGLGGVIGTAMGLTISNVISVFILWNMKKKESAYVVS